MLQGLETSTFLDTTAPGRNTTISSKPTNIFYTTKPEFKFPLDQIMDVKLNTTGLKDPVEPESSAVIGACFITLLAFEAGFIILLDAISVIMYIHAFQNQVGVANVYRA